MIGRRAPGRIQMPKIFIAFRFHVNFYHSYRGDAPDESGIGKDIRIIRGILDDLDLLNGEGIPAKGTWDIENHYSLAVLVPKHAPDILERWQSRVANSGDEIEAMSWNNGLVSAQTEEEFRKTMSWTVSNPEGSGLSDLFSEWAPIVRPQECMFTPSHLRLYPQFGIECVSLYYSSHPFNGFSTHIPLLETDQRYNPLTLSAPGFTETMTLLPSCNHGDLAENLGLRPWVKYLRKKQKDRDFLILIDMDADDEFWAGYGKLAKMITPSAGGLQSLVRSVCDLPYVKFCRPYDYVKNHEPAGSIEFGQDTADGSYDGLSSWAEKRENTRLWTQIARSRAMDRWTRELIGKSQTPAGVSENLESALKTRILTQTTTHFGLSSPVMHSGRLKAAEAMTAEAYEFSRKALEEAAGGTNGPPETRKVQKNAQRKTEETRKIQFPAKIKSGFAIPLPDSGGNWRLTEGASAKKRRVPGESPQRISGIDSSRILVSGPLRFSINPKGRIGLSLRDVPWLTMRHSGPALRYAGKEPDFVQTDFRPPMVVSEGLTRMSQKMEASLPSADEPVIWHGDFYAADDAPWILADVRVRYPLTPDRPGNKAKARLLTRSWDKRWQEIRPLELEAPFKMSDEAPLRVWKRNSFGDVSRFDPNGEHLWSMNNQITDPWLAVSGGGKGLLIGCSVVSETNFAFCPIRITGGSHPGFRLNPFGTYSGAQRRYPSKRTGIAFFLSSKMASHLDSYAPSYNGGEQRITVLLIPYEGDRPPEKITSAAETFGMPPWPGYLPWKNGTFPKNPTGHGNGE